MTILNYEMKTVTMNQVLKALKILLMTMKFYLI